MYHVFIVRLIPGDGVRRRLKVRSYLVVSEASLTSKASGNIHTAEESTLFLADRGGLDARWGGWISVI